MKPHGERENIGWIHYGILIVWSSLSPRAVRGERAGVRGVAGQIWRCPDGRLPLTPTLFPCDEAAREEENIGWIHYEILMRKPPFPSRILTPPGLTVTA